ncbi:NAD(P)H-dependent oxidoreductase [Campylobacter insulaenigrae]|uniref:NAD(P)H-dependent oxidoreductase n=1 Tax=Campylobacter insulaenigrae TaxID=260714 RepID=UPI00215213C2|nr:NAD(P)H-dependent oxidoreductase [Campylobacter insulaenigrae]MCR6593576.1 NAD(P)H-dependent oxidoreductase [Campylobacter insulaenigrae]
MKVDYLKLMEERSSIKAYTNKNISKKDLEYILECARLSPSSLGLEPWKFLVFQSQEKKEELSKIAYNQAHVAECSAVIVIVSRADFANYFKEKIQSKKLSEEVYNKVITTYTPFVENMSLEEKFIYAKEQSYIALANILNAAHSLNLGSCAIGGFNKDQINEYLKLDTNKERVSVLVTLGYANTDTKSHKVRFNFEEVIEFKD